MHMQENTAGGSVTTETDTVGSASAGTAIAVTQITAWSAGAAPSLGTAITADDITAWSANTPSSMVVTNGVLTFSAGTAASLNYTEKTIPNVTSVGSVPSLTKVDKNVPNISVTETTVVTSVTSSGGGGGESLPDGDEVSY